MAPRSNARANNGWTGLMIASGSGSLDMVQALLDRGAEVNAKANDGTTALMVARDAEIKALLMQAGAKP
jgi:uncharacterized protein